MAKARERKDNFIFYEDWVDAMNGFGLSDAQFRAVICAAVEYNRTRHVPTEDELDQVCRMMFATMQTRMDKNARKDIYAITNNIDGKVYVGQAANPNKRFRQHIAGDKSLISRAIRRYGVDNFTFEILEEGAADYDEREHYWIAELNSMFPNGYNMKP